MPSPGIDLKLRLTLRVAALAAACFAVAVSGVLLESDRAAGARADRIAEIVAKELKLQQEQSRWIKGTTGLFPDLQTVAATLMEPGLCIAYRTPSGETLQSLCGGVAPSDASAPPLFAAFYRRLVGADRESVRPIIYGNAVHGEAVASIDRQSIIGQSWREASRLVAVLGATLLALCVLVYAALADALRPTRAIRVGLERLGAGDLSTRLPPFDLAELSAVGSVFNHLADSLGRTTAERNELTRRLIAVQDEERRHLARELHDEFGQCLAAISAVAAAAGQTARREYPALAPDCQSIARTAAHMMQMLRGTLLRLRSPDVEELGLAASLEGLVTGWNGRGGGTQFGMELCGGLDALPRNFAASLYRVAQEAITNAAKHAQASRVTLRLRMRPAADGEQPEYVDLTVEDDGSAAAAVTLKSGMGLLGMRERITGLGGTLSMEALHPSGLGLYAQIPIPPATTRVSHARNAA